VSTSLDSTIEVQHQAGSDTLNEPSGSVVTWYARHVPSSNGSTTQTPRMAYVSAVDASRLREMLLGP
jgi:hypothetical protein